MTLGTINSFKGLGMNYLAYYYTAASKAVQFGKNDKNHHCNCKVDQHQLKADRNDDPFTRIGGSSMIKYCDTINDH